MKIVKSIQELQKYRNGLDGSVGFVPTMGALHEGHLSLIKAARENDHVIVSVYVNPTQFLPGEDLDRYPRQQQKDIKACEKAGVDAIFLPDTLYNEDELAITAPRIGGYVLEGAFRPGHFDGMLQVVLKLLNLTRPAKAYFGKKDAQQYLLIQKMVRDLFLNVEIVGCPTLRDADGLAKSSRNVYLSDSERARALSISKALQKAKELIENGEREWSTVQAVMEQMLQLDKLQYVACTDYDLQPLHRLEKGQSLITLAGFVGNTRLIDNLWV